MSMGVGGIVHAERHRWQRALVQDDVNILDHGAGHLRHAHVGFDELDLVPDLRQVAAFARQQIIDDPHEASLAYQVAGRCSSQ